MPFEEQTIVDLRQQMIAAVQRGVSIAQVARDFGISRPTVYEWLARWDPNEELSLANRSHARHTQAAKTPEAIEQLLIAERKRWRFGSKKILQGTIKWAGEAIFIGEGLAGERVGLKPLDYDTYEVYFARFLIGRIHADKFL